MVINGVIKLEGVAMVFYFRLTFLHGLFWMSLPLLLLGCNDSEKPVAILAAAESSISGKIDIQGGNSYAVGDAKIISHTYTITDLQTGDLVYGPEINIEQLTDTGFSVYPTSIEKTAGQYERLSSSYEVTLEILDSRIQTHKVTEIVELNSVLIYLPSASTEDGDDSTNDDTTDPNQDDNDDCLAICTTSLTDVDGIFTCELTTDDSCPLASPTVIFSSLQSHAASLDELAEYTYDDDSLLLIQVWGGDGATAPSTSQSNIGRGGDGGYGQRVTTVGEMDDTILYYYVGQAGIISNYESSDSGGSGGSASIVAFSDLSAGNYTTEDDILAEIMMIAGGGAGGGASGTVTGAGDGGDGGVSLCGETNEDDSSVEPCSVAGSDGQDYKKTVLFETKTAHGGKGGNQDGDGSGGDGGDGRNDGQDGPGGYAIGYDTNSSNNGCSSETTVGWLNSTPSDMGSYGAGALEDEHDSGCNGGGGGGGYGGGGAGGGTPNWTLDWDSGGTGGGGGGTYVILSTVSDADAPTSRPDHFIDDSYDCGDDDGVDNYECDRNDSDSDGEIRLVFKPSNLST